MYEVFRKPGRWQIVWSEKHDRNVWAILARDGETIEEIDADRPVDDPYDALEAFSE